MLARIADELHRQYELGYRLPARDGKVHHIEVRVKRPGMTARARRTYTAPRPEARRVKHDNADMDFNIKDDME